MTNKQHLEHRLQIAQEKVTKASNEGDYKAFEHWNKEVSNLKEMIDFWSDKNT